MIEDPATPLIGKIAVILTRLKSIKCTHVNEQTKAPLARILRYKGLSSAEDMDSDEWYTLLDKVSKHMEKLKLRRLPRDHIQIYPLDPHDLPGNVFQK